MSFFSVEEFEQSTPRTVKSARLLPNGVEMYVTIFNPVGSDEHVCTVAACLPSSAAAEPQYARVGSFTTLAAAVDAANTLAEHAANEDPRVIFGPF